MSAEPKAGRDAPHRWLFVVRACFVGGIRRRPGDLVLALKSEAAQLIDDGDVIPAIGPPTGSLARKVFRASAMDYPGRYGDPGLRALWQRMDEDRA